MNKTLLLLALTSLPAHREDVYSINVAIRVRGEK